MLATGIASKPVWVSKGEKYDSGFQPNITSINYFVSPIRALETHRAEWNNQIWYRMATLDFDEDYNVTTNWSDSIKIDEEGYHPVSLHLDNDLILTMWQETSSDKTWYKTGELNGNEIEWTSGTVSEFKGKSNDVVQLKSGHLLNVHEDPDSNNLVYKLGRWKEESNRVVFWHE